MLTKHLSMKQKWENNDLRSKGWRGTVAGKVLLAVKEAGKMSEDDLMRTVSSKLIVPAWKVARDKMA